MTADLVASLLAWAALFMAGPRLAEAPPVVVVPQRDLAALVCGRPCPALGLYAGGTIFLADTLDPTGLPARAVLVHELVHAIQAGRDGPVADCADAARREREAAAVAGAYLVAHGALPVPTSLVGRTCRE